MGRHFVIRAAACVLASLSPPLAASAGDRPFVSNSWADDAGGAAGVIADGVASPPVKPAFGADRGDDRGGREDDQGRYRGAFRFVFDQGPMAGTPGAVMVGRVGAALTRHGSTGVGATFAVGERPFGRESERTTPGDPGAFMGDWDAPAIRYAYRSGGLDIGASLEPGGAVDMTFGDGADRDDEEDDRAFWDGRVGFAANYRRELGPLAFGLGGGVRFDRREGRYHLGAEAGYQGFSLAGFMDRNEGRANADGDLLGFGAAYRGEAFAIGGGYVHADADAGGRDEDFVHFGGGLRLAPGVSAFASAQYGEEADRAGYGAFAGLGLRF